jgi:serine/threonine protein kinase
VKRVRKQRAAWDEKKEIAAMAKVRQFPQYFAYLHGWYESQDWIYLAMDYFEMGNLSHHLANKLPENQARDITQQLLRGLVELHGMGITHHDLKPTDIFVVSRSTSSWDVRIGDFGIAKRVNADETALRTITGTRQYMAPELDPWLVDDEEAHSYTQAVDIWALGILLFQILTLQAAFKDPSSLRKYFKGKTIFPKEPLLQESTTSPCIEFLMAVLQPKPADTPTLKDTFRYEWMKASSGDPSVSAIQQSFSEVHAFKDCLAVGNSFNAQQHQSAERRKLPYLEDAISRRAQSASNFMEMVPQQLREESSPRPPSQRAELAAHVIATGNNLSPLTARIAPLLKATSRLDVDGAVEMPPYDSKQELMTDIPEHTTTESTSTPANVSSLGGGTTAALPPGLEKRHTPEGRPYYVDHNTRQTSWNLPRTSASGTHNAMLPYTITSPRLKEPPSVPNLRLTGMPALRLETNYGD